MEVTYTPAELAAFEDEIAAQFLAKQIHAPVHLAGGNEEQLIRVFQEHVNEEDWVLCGWRAHYHCLLKGVPMEELRQAILRGRSISLCFPEHRVLSSGIVGGTAPIAVGLAMGIKRNTRIVPRPPQPGEVFGEPRKVRLDRSRKVVCFLGDMTAESGIVHESVKYAVNFDLPVLFVVEDNGLSVDTDTAAVWGHAPKPKVAGLSLLPAVAEGLGPYREDQRAKVLRYHYMLTRPHVGIGKHVEF